MTQKILLTRLSCRFAISGSVLSGVRSYLSGLLQAVSIDCIVFNASLLTCGDPQESVLGPLFFTLYITSLYDFSRAHGLHGHFYAVTCIV